jgi:hypothetical protein
MKARKGIFMTNRILRLTLSAAMALAVGMPLEASAQMKPAGEPMAKPVQEKTMKAKKEPTAGQLAARERMGKCSAEWKETKAAGKLASGAKWPKFWSECNTRLKGGTKA